MTLDLIQAAALLHMSPDALLRKARAGIVPADKPARRWVFIEEDLLAWMRKRAQERACHSIASQRARTGGSDSRSAESRLDARLKQLTAKPLRNSRPVFGLICGGKSNSGNIPDIRGEKPSTAGTSVPTAATKHGTRSA